LYLTLALMLPLQLLAAEVSGTLTILEGSALVYRAAGRLQAVPAMRVSSGDIIETPSATFAQIELVDRSVLQLGPSTRLLIGGPGSKQKSERVLYLLDGWIKLNGSQHEAALGSGFEMRTPLVEVPASSAVVVIRQSPSDINLFVERGELRIGERQGGGASVPVALKSGDFYTRKAGARGAVAGGASKAFIAEVPAPFRDSLPPMADKFGDRVAQPLPGSEFTYADVERWLKAEPAVRRPLMSRWRGKVHEPAFRTALISNLSAHPEWDPILFPEKYLPKPSPPFARAAMPLGRPSSNSAAASASTEERKGAPR